MREPFTPPVIYINEEENSDFEKLFEENSDDCCYL